MTVAHALPNGKLDGAELQNGVHEVLHGDPRKLTMPIKAVEDKYELLPAFLKVDTSYSSVTAFVPSMMLGVPERMTVLS